MSEFRKLKLGSLVKLAVDSRGITNGSMDILSFEYDVDSDIDKIVDYVENNDFPELKDEIDIIKNQSDELEDKIKNTAIEILSLQMTTEQLNRKIQEYNFIVGNQYENLLEMVKSISDKLEPKIIIKEKIIEKQIPELIEIRTTVYRGVKTDEEIRTEQEIINQGRRRHYNAPSGWFEYSDEWMVQLLFGREIVFMKKNLYNECVQNNIPFYSMYDAKKWHRQFDKK